jgi:signal peptidase I
MPGIFGPESESDSEEDVRQINYANYNVGDFIRFKKTNQGSISYGVISKILDDTSQGKSYDIIYYDTGRSDDSATSNPVTTTVLRENISPVSLDPIIQLRHYDSQFRMLYDVTKIPVAEIPEEIREPLQAALNTTNSLDTPSASRSTTTGTSYGDNSRSSSSSISRSSSSGGKKYRKKKNKTKRRNKKTKRRRNRKSKRR